MSSENKMRILLVYGTRWGGTVDVAEKIGCVFREEGWSVDIFSDKEEMPKVDSYDLVVVGSGIRADKWTNRTMDFIERNASELRVKKTALFVSCQMADRENEAHDKAKKEYLEKVAEKYGLNPISYGFFGGYMDFSKSHGLIS